MLRRSRASERPRHRWLLALVVLAAAFGGLVALGALRVARIASHLRVAQDDIEAASSALEAGELRQSREHLDAALATLTVANGELHNSVELQLVSGLPVVSQNIDSVQDSVRLSMSLVTGGREVILAAAQLEGADGKLEVPLASGALPLAAVVGTQRELALLGALLPGPSEKPGGKLLVGPVRELRDRIYNTVASRREQVDSLSRALRVVGDLAGAEGPRRYLIAVANTAEMRGTGGMILSYGELLSKDGDFELGAFGRIDELQLDAPLPPESVSLPEDYLRRWSGFDVTLRWRNATMAADLPLIAPNLLEMYQAATGVPADGVIQIDPHGLAAVLEGIGPVQVPGLGQVTAETVVPFTLNEAYVRFPGIDERSDVLGDIAEAVFTKLVEGRYPSLRPLGEALVKTARSGHILAFASNGGTQGDFRWFGVDGGLPQTSALFHLTAQNLSGNKLDYFVEPALALRGSLLPGAIGTLTAEITLHNDAPVGQDEPAYIFGPFSANVGRQVAGQYRSVVSLYVPSGTDLAGFSGEVVSEPVVLTEGGRTVVSYTVDVFAGTAPAVSLFLTMAPRPAGPFDVYLSPSPRVHPTAVTVDLDIGEGRVEGDVLLDRTWRFAAGERPAAIRPRDVPRDLDGER